MNIADSLICYLSVLRAALVLDGIDGDLKVPDRYGGEACEEVLQQIGLMA